MKHGLMHSTLREMQALAFSPRFWGLILLATAVLGVTGPFGTYERLTLLPRLAYWLALALATFTAGYAAIRLVGRALFEGRAVPPVVRALVTGLAAGVPVAIVVTAFDWAALSAPIPHASSAITLFLNCALIAAALSLASVLIEGETSADTEPQAASTLPDAGSDTAASRQSTRPPLLDRLPPPLRGRLTSLSMQDHYVEVHTDKGSTLLLMRMADAMRETEGEAGLQIHRSHWVALDAITGTARQDGKLFLKLKDGTQLPVSRSFAAAVREAGFR
ncbi:hypothetical protein MAUB1S_09424 [Mycolicibacterium aubagnense]